jgi:CRP-like cAMP-binding protein
MKNDIIQDANLQKIQQMLRCVPEDIREQVVDKCINAGKTIAFKGTHIENVFILEEGTIRVINEFTDGHRYSFAQLIPPNFIGDLEVLAGQENYATTLETVTPCRMKIMSVPIFWELLSRDPALLMVVAKDLAKKMYPTSNESGTVKFFSGIHKLQAYLIREYEGDGIFLLKKNRQEIADEIGTGVKTVNRCINRLKEEKLICVIKGKVQIDSKQYVQLVRTMDCIVKL